MATLSIEPNERITYGIAHEDDDLLVVIKPARRVTQPGKGHDRDSLLNGLFAKYGTRLQNLGAARDFGLLHRLDRDTSGLVLVALRASVYDDLRELFRQRAIGKYYWALTGKPPREEEGTIRRAIAEEERKESRYKVVKRARVARSGKPALTAWRVLERTDMGALIEARPVTGRLHQIRVHLASIGSPVLGDGFYGSRAARGGSPRLALHAHRLTFTHPVTGAPVDAHASWPHDLKRVLRHLDLHRPDLPRGAEDPDELEEPNDQSGSGEPSETGDG